MTELKGQAAIVTGGGTGVGRATVLDLARRGCHVLVNYSRSRDDAEATAAEARSLGVKALAFAADVSDDAACRAMVAEAQRQLGRLDILVNNAGTTRFIKFNDLEAVTDDDFLRLYAVNVLGPFHCIRAAAPALAAGGVGQVINVSSIAALCAKGSSIPYTASKAALNNMTVALARTLAPKIRVNAVAPGFIDTRWTRGYLGDNYEAHAQAVAETNPLGTICHPEDISAAILSLLCGSSLVTGQIVVVDAGTLIR